MPATTACAKINLYLRVEDRLPSGYHRITSLILPVPGLADSVSLQPAAGARLRMQCSDPDLPCDEGNLCMRAARAFAEAADRVPSWTLQLDKRIPVAAGLGGGSSDAAAVLRLLNDLHTQRFSPAELVDIAAGIGADVPFFLDPRPQLVTGFGEKLQPISHETPLGLILANPGFPVPARWAYEHWPEADSEAAPDPAEMLAALGKGGKLDRVAAHLHNDLEQCVFRKFPLLDMLRESMLEAGCRAVLCSGSGPTLLGICPPADTAAIHQKLTEATDEPLWTFAATMP